MTKFKFPYETSALRICQPLGEFYAVSLPVDLLLEVCASHTLSATMKKDESGYILNGTQRLVEDARLKEIARYINRFDSTFPNSIIIAGNHNFEEASDKEKLEQVNLKDSGSNVGPPSIWTIGVGKNGCFKLVIPSSKKQAAIIDGQIGFSLLHRPIQKLEKIWTYCVLYF